MNKKINFYLLLVALVFMLAGIATAAPNKPSSDQTVTVITANTAVDDGELTDPVKMLEDITGNVLHALQHHKGSNSLSSIYNLVNKFILPYVDFNEMSVWIAGRTVWGKASEQARNQFIDAFKVLLVRTYATALNTYTNEKVEFGPQHFDSNKQRIQITSTIVRSGNNNNVHLVYRLIKNDNKWFVYDIIIEGVSILQGFQAQFSDEIRQSGLQKVTAQIEEHNKQKNA